MYKRQLLLLFIFVCVLAHPSCGQGEVPVNFYTGTPGISVDLYTVIDHDLGENLRMTYDANGGSIYGYGWSLDAGGTVSRVVRGLPDDFADATRTGWLYNANASNVLNFANSSDLDPATYTDESADFNFIDGLQYLRDTEPDVFTFSVGGVSGKFIFNNSGTISLIPYQDISIVPIYTGTAPANKTISGWTITTPTGITYTFNDLNTVTRSLTKSGNNQTAMSALERDFRYYNTAVAYAYTWMVSVAQSFTGAQLTYTYTTPVTTTTTRAKSATIIDQDATKASLGVQNLAVLMNETTVVTSKTLTKIAAANNGPWALINGNGNVTIFDPAYSSTIALKTFRFDYQTDYPDLLASITEIHQCATLPPYKFTYNIPPVVDGSPVDQFNNYLTPLGIQQDLWGYSNGQTYSSALQQFPTIYVYPNEPASERYRLYRIPNYSGTEIILNGNSNRNPNGQFPTLKRMIYPTGGELDLLYEPNTYYDSRTGKDAVAGGVRINWLSYYDGVNPLGKIVKSFNYQDAAGHSSGKLLRRPMYALPVWAYISPDYATGQNPLTRTYSTLASGTTTSLWQSLTLVTNFDLSDPANDGPIVGYTQVTVSRSGSGKAVYNYYVPAAYGDAATGSGATDWAPTTLKFARPSNISASILQNASGWLYPTFAVQAYDYEQGLVWKKTEYNESNVPVRTTQTTYQYVYGNGAAPTTITALAYDKFSNSAPAMYLYGRYRQLADVSKVVATETVTTVDENNTALSSTQSVQNIFASPNHRYVSRVNSTTPDGTVYSTSFQYVQDYPYSGTPTDSTLWMIKLLVDQHRTATVVEQVNTVQPAGGTEKTTSASLVKYRPVTLAGNQVPLAKWQMAYRPDAPSTTFTKSYASGNVFYSFNDARYQVVNTMNEYDAYGLPVSSTGEDRVTSGTLWGYGQRQPVATFRQARSISLAFSDFETTTGASFTATNDYYGAGRTGKKGVHPYATLTRTLVKPGNATNYLLSFWAKPASGNTTLSLKVSLNGGAATTYTFTYKTGVTDYQYFTQSIPVSSMPTNFTVSVSGQAFFTQPSGSSSSLLPLLDDIGFYPDYATLTSVTYQQPYGVNASTDASGVSAFTSYDSLGRVMLVMDQDHNIRQRYTYQFTGQAIPAYNPGITGNSSYYVNTSFNFRAGSGASTPCITNTTYTWYIDSQLSGTGSQSPTLSYNSTGTHTVTLQASHPEYGAKTVNKTFTIVNAPPPPLSVSISYAPSGLLTVFTPAVTGDDGDDAITYQWYTRPTGSGSWTLRSNSFTYTAKILAGASLDVMCTIITYDQRTASATVTVSH